MNKYTFEINQIYFDVKVITDEEKIWLFILEPNEFIKLFTSKVDCILNKRIYESRFIPLIKDFLLDNYQFIYSTKEERYIELENKEGVLNYNKIDPIIKIISKDDFFKILYEKIESGVDYNE